MNVREGYKQTDIGMIPVDWEAVELGDVCEKIVGGGTPSKENLSFWENGTIYWASVKDMKGSKYLSKTTDTITEEGLKNSSANLIPANSLITSTRMAVGQFFINTVPMAINQDLKALILHKEFDLDFVFWSLIHNSKKLNDMGTGTTVKGIKLNELRGLKLSIPPLQEQQKIADILSTVDQKIDSIDTKIEETQTLKRGLMQRLLSEGIGHSEFKESEIGRIPTGWEVKTIASCCKNFDGMRIPIKSEDRQQMQGDYPYYGAQGIIDYVNDYIFSGTYLLVAEDGENVRGQKYDIAFVVEGQFWVNNHAHILQPNDETNIRYISNVLNYMDITKYVTGTGQPKLNKAQLQSIKIPFPPLEEQKQIAEILSTTDEKLEILRAKKETFETLKKGLMQKLLTGKIRVKGEA